MGGTRVRLALLAIVVAVPSVASAGKKVKAEVLCGLLVDGAVKEVVPNKTKPRIVQPVACALHLSAEGDDTFMGNIHTVRYTVDDKGKKKKIVTQGETNDIENATNLKKDVELTMKPGAADERGEVLFQPCEDFDVVASVFDDRGTYFTKTIHVAQSCPKPKPMKAKAGCYATNEAGDRIDLPSKKKPKLEGYTIQCWVTSTDQRFFSGKLKFSGQTEYFAHTTNDTDGHTLSDVRVGTYEDGEDESSYSFTLQSDDIPLCLGTFDIKLYLDDESGARLFSTKITVKEGC